jgi:hypothetical protein
MMRWLEKTDFLGAERKQLLAFALTMQVKSKVETFGNGK